MEQGNQHHYHHLYNPSYLQTPYLNVTQDVVLVGGSGDQRERLPQWSNIETKEFLALRWELDRSFMETKRNKVLWELISTKMKEKGFYRTPDQCKCKWKNLVTRYKGSEAVEAETNRMFPFQVDMRKIFSDRMERLLSFDEENKGIQPREFWSDEEEVQTVLEDEPKETKKKKKRKTMITFDGGSSSSGAGSREEAIKNSLKNFMRWQMQMEVEWIRASEAREVERKVAEMEWRKAMEALATERADMDRRWKEKEEERRMREEERAERRHQLLLELLSKLINNNGI